MNFIILLFIGLDLDTWANVLQIIGFFFGLGAFLIGLFINSQISKLKSSYLFDKTVNEHIKYLENSTSSLNLYFKDYDNYLDVIKIEYWTCQAELEDLASKLSYCQGSKCRKLIRFIKRRKSKHFTTQKSDRSVFINFIMKPLNSFVQTTYDDTWTIYYSMLQIIRQVENLRKNKKSILK